MNGKVIAVDTLRALADRWATDRNYTGSPSDDIRALIDEPTASQKPEAVRLRDELRERADFEAWASLNGCDLSVTKDDPILVDGVYAVGDTYSYWVVWQAAVAETRKQEPDAPQFHHVKKVAEHFNMAVTPKDMAEAIAGAPDSLFSMETAHKAFAGIGKQRVGESCTHEWRTAGGGSQAHRPLVCSKCNQHRDHMPQQVGEVQG